MMNLDEYIDDVVRSRVANKVQDKYISTGKYTQGEEYEYFVSDDYAYHLDYLINTWKTHIENEFYYDITYDGNFQYISKYFEDGLYCPDFNDEWVDDIFERNILDTNILK